jgi:hypothetical protein
VADYEKMTGLDLTTRAASERALLGGLTEADFYQEPFDLVMALLNNRKS